MLFDELIDRALTKNREHLERATRSIVGVSEWDLNKKAANGDWSPGQVFQHLILANAPYIGLLRTAVDKAPPAREGTVRHTTFGEFLAKQAGPGPNTPAPKSLVPEEGNYGAATIEEWIAGQEKLYTLFGECRGKDLNVKIVRNPIIGLFKMNLGDILELLTAHTERHIGQIEERLHHAESSA